MQDLDELIEKKKIIYNEILDELEKLVHREMKIDTTIRMGGYIYNPNNISYDDALENRIRKIQNNKMTLSNAAKNSFNRIKKIYLNNFYNEDNI